MEVKLESGDKFNIPSGCMAVVSDGVVTIEKETPFKVGDFLYYYEEGWGFGVCIFMDFIKESANGIYYYAATDVSGEIMIEDCFSTEWDVLRIATEEEKNFLLNRLHDDGKDWDAVNKKIVEYKWRPKYGEPYYMINTLFNVLKCTWSSSGFSFDLLQKGNCFKTEEEAQAKADEIIKILNK